MTQRERILILAIGGLIALWGVWSGYQSYQQAYDRRVQELARLDDDLFDEEMAGREARRALRRLERYQRQSLPEDLDVAKSAYRAWCSETIKQCGLDFDSVKSSPSRREVEGAATELEFDVDATGSPEAIARLLDAYYRLDVAHKITSLSLTPATPGGGAWDLSLKTTALAIEGAQRQAGLPEQELAPPRLLLAAADDYAEQFSQRNLFAAYKPPPPPRPEPKKVVRKTPPAPPKPPAFDDAKHAQLTGIVETGEGLQAWVLVRTTGETLRLRAGDDLSVGLLQGTVDLVERDSLLIRLESGDRLRVGLGDKLREGEKLSVQEDA